MIGLPGWQGTGQMAAAEAQALHARTHASQGCVSLRRIAARWEVQLRSMLLARRTAAAPVVLLVAASTVGSLPVVPVLPYAVESAGMLPGWR